MTENKRYVRILDYSEKEVRIFDEHNQKNIFNIFFMGLDSAICLKGALEDTVDLLNYFNDENDILKQKLKTKYIVNKQYEELQRLKEDNEQLKQRIKELEIENTAQSDAIDGLQATLVHFDLEEVIK